MTEQEKGAIALSYGLVSAWLGSIFVGYCMASGNPLGIVLTVFTAISYTAVVWGARRV